MVAWKASKERGGAEVPLGMSRRRGETQLIERHNKRFSSSSGGRMKKAKDRDTR